MTTSKAVMRARSMLGTKVTYILGAGGRNPLNDYPMTVKNGKLGCDCSGWVAWCQGLDRYQPNYFHYSDGWMNTDSIIADARGKRDLWVEGVAPRPGDALVYPGKFKNGKRVAIGHITLVESVPWAEEPPDWRAHAKGISTIDCAAALSRRLTGYAIARRDATLWAGKPDSVVVRLRS